jgi:uncharacterized tellurite resistance protein B-like protein
VLGASGRDWAALQRHLVDALAQLSEQHGRDGVAWVCAVPPAHAGDDARWRLGALFAFPGDVGEAHVATLEAALRRSGAAWRGEGIRAIPRRAFPTLAVSEGAVYHLWVAGRGGVTEPRLVVDEDGDLLQTRVAATAANREDYLEGALHAVAVDVARPPPAEDSLEACKVVFALSVCERILEADGHVDDAEVEFLRRTFPPRRLEALGLQDRLAFLLVRQKAAEVLAHELSPTDKLALMGLFWRAGQSDGSLDGAELQILRDTAVALRVEWDEVETYLRDLW